MGEEKEASASERSYSLNLSHEMLLPGLSEGSYKMGGGCQSWAPMCKLYPGYRELRLGLPAGKPEICPEYFPEG